MKSKLFVVIVFMSNLVFAQGITTEQWQTDLTLYHQLLEKNHIDLYHQIDKPSFENEIGKIRTSISHLSDWDIALKLMSLTRKVSDGHTAVSIANWESHAFPITVKKISGKWRVVKAPAEKREILGAHLKSIDDTDVSDIEKRLSSVAQYVENSYSEVVRIGEYMPISELLYALKIIKLPQKATFGWITDKGEKLNTTLIALQKDGLLEQQYIYLPVQSSAVVKPENTDFEYLWYTTIEGTKATYIRFDDYPQFEDMVPFVESLIQFITQHQSKQLVIDLRHNGGGDFYVGLVLANALNLIDSVDWKNGVYVLTSGVTFSAGASNAAQFRQLLNAKIVGTPTGSNPTGYQDMGVFVLPNSKLRITYSKRMFRIQETPTLGVQPDILIAPNWSSNSKGIDNVLEEVIKQLNESH